MNNQHCWYNLNLDVSNALRADFDITGITPGIKNYPNVADIFTIDWLEYIESLGLPISSVLIFCRLAGEEDLDAHADVHSKPQPGSEYRAFAINWVIGGQNSEMRWYKMPENTTPIRYTPANTPYITWPIKELTEVDRCCIQGQPTMVRVNVPHAISVKDEPRICISVRTNAIPDDWDRAVDRLLNKQILIPR
jgi:hypothetical protein